MSKIEKLLPNFNELTPARCEQVATRAIDTFRERLKGLEDAPATVRDFLIPWDQANAEFDRATAPIFNLMSAVGGEEFDALEQTLNEPLTRLDSWITTNESFYNKFRELDTLDLDEESAYFVETELKDFRLGGTDLDVAGRKELEDIDLEIASIATQYGQKVAKMLAKKVEVGGKEYTLNNFTNQLALVDMDDPADRKEMLDISMQRGFGGEFDTRDLVLKMAKARAKRAQLLGYESHAQLVLETETAPSTKVVYDLLSDVAQAALKTLAKEKPTLVARARKDGVENFSASDWLYYQEREKKDSLGLSSDELKPYLELWNVVENGVFYAANKIYGLTATRREDLAGWDPSMRVYEIADQEGKSLGLFLLDPFTRPGKSGGAWMDTLIQGYSGTDYESIILNCANFKPVADGEQKFLVWDEVETLFHEFGHAIHGFLSKTRYSETAGTAVPRDFVELPSQLNEMWAYNPQVIQHFARHFETGQPMPEGMRAQLQDSKTFGQAHATVEFCAAALLDQAWYSDPHIDQVDDVAKFEAEALQRAGVSCALVPPRYRSTYFPHAFTVGYDAGYYSYMWAEAMVAECENWFRTRAAKDGDGGLNRDAGRAITDAILSRGSSRDPRISFKELIGHDASATAILSRRGL